MTNAVAVAQYGSASPSWRNRIINGNMSIDQRNAGAATANTINGYTIDRWQVQQSVTGKVIAQQNAGSVTPPAGFSKYLGVTSQSAYTVGSTDYYNCLQYIEGYNIADLNWGTSSAKTVTLSFWVYSSLTGNFGASINNANGSSNAFYPFSYTISSANTWTYITITIPGPSIGTWTNNNTYGLGVFFSLGLGSSYQGGGNAWTSSAYYIPTGCVSVVGTNGATWYVTGVQLEVGSQATPFEQRLYGTELALCQRYYWLATLPIGYTLGPGSAGSSGLRMPVSMRAAPSLTGSPTFSVGSGSAGTPSLLTGTGISSSTDGVYLYNASSNWTTGVVVSVNNAGFSSEL